jgi:undecaprenyl diphosphate synthase
MTAMSSPATDTVPPNDTVPANDTAPLRHIIVVGGTLDEWSAMSDAQWSARLDELGKVADHVGASWLTLRPYSGDAGAGADERLADVGSCRVAAQSVADGRARVAHAVAALVEQGSSVTEATIDEQLNLPALADPDLVVIVGPSRRLPVSLVWELAYAELVFVDTTWQHLGAAHLDDAITSYAHRHRRFGGID